MATLHDVQPDEANSSPVSTDEAPKSRPALSRIKRELTDDELAEPGARKLILDMLYRAEDDERALRPFRDKFHALDKQNGILLEKLRISIGFEVLSLGTLSIGSLAFGYALSLPSTSHGKAAGIAFGIVLMLVGIGTKVIQKWN